MNLRVEGGAQHSSVHNTAEGLTISKDLSMVRSLRGGEVLRLGAPVCTPCLVPLPKVWHWLRIQSPPKLSDVLSPAHGRPSSAGQSPQSMEVFREKTPWSGVPHSPRALLVQIVAFLFLIPHLLLELGFSFCFSFSEFGGRISDSSPSLPLKCSM